MSSVLEETQVCSLRFITIERHGEMVACVDYNWVSSLRDCFRADQGELTSGPVLYVCNLRVMSPDRSLIWMLKRQLPQARWIVGLTEDYRLIAPKGVPDGFLDD